MPKYRLANNVSSSVTMFIKPDKVAYQLMRPLTPYSWEAIQPPIEERPTSRKFIDPNVVNQKAGLPPLYVVFEVRTHATDVQKWLEDNFDNLEFSKRTPNDYIFTGEFKGYVEEDESELSDAPVAEAVS